MSDELLHLKDLRALHVQFVDRIGHIQDPAEGFAVEGICNGCIVDMATEVHKSAAREIGVRRPTGPEVVPIAFQVYTYGIYMGLEIARSR